MDLPNLHNQLRDEERRLEALADLAILDTPVEAEFDDLTMLAASALGAESAAISLVDHDRQWFKSRVNLAFAETPRDVAFCHHTVDRRELLVVKDATQDPRFRDNPLVTAEGGIRFYAGAPLILDNGYCIGSLCVIDPAPRPDFQAKDADLLDGLARLASRLLSARRNRQMGEIAAKVVHATTDAIVAADRSGKIVLLNNAAEDLFGYPAAEALGQSIELLMPERFRHGHQLKIENAGAGGPTRLLNTFVELPIKTADGRELETELSLAPWGESQEDGGFAAIFREITERKALEHDRQEARAFLDAIVDNLPAMLFVKDAETRKYVMVNERAAEATGIRQSKFIGKTDRQLLGDDGARFERQDEETIRKRTPQQFEESFTRPDGRNYHVRTTRVMMDGPKGKDQYILGMVEDITDIRLSEAENARLARYDSLTGLLNRETANELMHEQIEAGEPFALLSIDLDRFKSVNDQFGHLAGDAVLQEVAERLRDLGGKDCLVGRLGADEFVMSLTGARLEKRAAKLAEQIVESLSVPFEVADINAHIGASVGVVFHPKDAATAEKLRECSSLALHRAKNGGGGQVCYFDDQMDASERDRQKLESDLRYAINQGEIRLFYQPIVSSQTGRVTSMEALARWQHPTRGAICPETFISLTEDCGLIDELGAQLLDLACRDAQAWPADLRVAVNLSPQQFKSGNLVSTVRDALERSGLDPDRLQLEVTERLVIDNTESTFAQLRELRDLGIKLLIDDFGVGHSSLSYFRIFPFDKVKIDKSFVEEIETSAPSRAIVEAVVGLGRQLSMGIVAEGVETEEQRKMLADLGCTHLQGYLFSKAMPPEEVAPFVARLSYQGNDTLRVA